VKLKLTRRALLGSVAGLAANCSRTDPPATGSPARAGASAIASGETRSAEHALVVEKELDFPTSAVGSEKATLLVPNWAPPGERFPVLVALHGRGESVRGVTVGARAWLADYDLGRVMARLRAPPLTRSDFQGFVSEQRLAKINAALVERPFRGLVIACPWVPDLLSEKERGNLDAALPFGNFLANELVPRVLSESPAQTDPAAVGIDGVSLGGRAALVVGFGHAQRFAALGTLQAAITESEVPALARRAREAGAGTRPLRLLTSQQDYFLEAITALHTALDAEHVAHEFVVVPGPHDYAFNRGPGGIEMLLWHDRVLRGEPPI
jgi:enterochelin esterase-like enzyme